MRKGIASPVTQKVTKSKNAASPAAVVTQGAASFSSNANPVVLVAQTATGQECSKRVEFYRLRNLPPKALVSNTPATELELELTLP